MPGAQVRPLPLSAPGPQGIIIGPRAYWALRARAHTRTRTHSTTQQVVRVLFDILKRKDSPLRLTAAELLGKGFAAWRSSSKDTKALVQVTFRSPDVLSFFACIGPSSMPDTHYHTRHTHNTYSPCSLSLSWETRPASREWHTTR
jgi:hypothetical protein